MGLVSFNSLHTNDLDKHTINWYTHNIGGKTMKRNPNDDYIVILGVLVLIGATILFGWYG